jgi:hypothetical protein
MRTFGALLLLVTLTAHGGQLSDPKADSEAILDAMLPLAERMLEEHGEFYPYGGAMTPDGKVISVAGDPGGEHPASQEVIDLLQAAFRSGAAAGKYKATGMFYDVRVVPPGATEKTDAIAVALDHKDNYSVLVCFPYRIVSGQLELGSAFASKGENKVFQK